MTDTKTLPHWQLRTIFEGLDSAEYEATKRRVESGVKELEALFGDRAIGSGGPLPPSDAVTETAETLIERFNEITTDLRDLWSYLYALVSTDAFNDEAQAELSGLKPLGSRLTALSRRAVAWLGRLDVDALAASSAVVRAHEYYLRRSQTEAKHLMGDDEEALAAALNPTSGSAWSKLHSDMISRHTVARQLPGKDAAEYGLAELKNLQHESEPELREAAFRAELELLERDAVAHGAAMNAIKGEVNELTRRRGYQSALEQALFDSAISRESLLAMQQACQEAFPAFRRYLKAKAKFLGKEVLSWYDLFAPVSTGEPRRYRWDEAREFIENNFRSYSDTLAEFARRAFEEHWFDVPPRKGKVNGAYCMEVFGRKESRILLNYGETLDDLFTVAHELGHAYHNDCMFRFGRSSIQSDTPMTLAETASIFCETIVVSALLEQSSEQERLAILEQDLSGSAQLVLDIHSRFLFESAVFDKRVSRELSIGELKSLMLEAQAATYAEAVNEDERHPYMWAHKGHYYSASTSFYNYPYTFGYLFGLGLYAEYQRDPDGFKSRYDELLAGTGMSDAAPLARRFGIDIEDPAFWRGSLSIAQERVGEYERLVAQFTA